MSRESFADGGYIEADFSGLEKLIENLEKGHYTDVGILGETGGRTEGGDLTVAGLGAVHEFGTIIRHPGGTPYRIEGGKAVFMKKGTPGPVTKAHLIPMPKRSFILMPMSKKQAKIQEYVEKRMAQHLQKGDVAGIFKDIGIAAESVIQEAFETGGFGEWPDIKDSTKARKGSDSILIADGILRKSVTSKAGES